nr:zinc finger protein ZPR1-like isoform X1 [Tanacetum cinerariifolium]
RNDISSLTGVEDLGEMYYWWLMCSMMLDVLKLREIVSVGDCGCNMYRVEKFCEESGKRQTYTHNHGSEVSSEVVSCSQGTVEPHGSIGALIGGRAIAQWNTTEFSDALFR